ncbi:hypothetical protein GW17_00036221 [Ensete ventricosum]|nr:hypothetical protein GW17_00036221 [Ensete ventricosum]RZR79468.1 hypothetical protein BHM03_00005197 [Ensete ventricosum]
MGLQRNRYAAIKTFAAPIFRSRVSRVLPAGVMEDRPRELLAPRHGTVLARSVIDCSKNISYSTFRERNEMAAGRGYTSARLEQLMSGGGGDGTTRGLVQVILGVVGPSQEVAGEDRSPPDRIVLVNPVTQGMVVLQGDPDLMAEILSERGVGDGGRGAGDPPPASKASIEAMRTVSVEEGEGMRQEECPVCLDELVEGGKEASAAAVVVREMPCGHRFHEGCIVKWLGMNGSCPVCRFRMPPEEGGDPKKDDGEGEGAENDEQRRRIRGMWLTIVYRRGRGEISDQPSQSPGEEGGGGGYSGGDAAAAGVSAESDGGIERVDQ